MFNILSAIINCPCPLVWLFAPKLKHSPNQVLTHAARAAAKAPLVAARARAKGSG